VAEPRVATVSPVRVRIVHTAVPGTYYETLSGRVGLCIQADERVLRFATALGEPDFELTPARGLALYELRLVPAR